MASENSNATVGGFTGNPYEAFTPPAAGSCCGSTPTDDPTDSSSGYCGTDSVAAATGCCGSTAVTKSPAAMESPATSGGCCG